MKKKLLIIICLCLVIAVLAAQKDWILLQAKEAALKILINNSASKIAPIIKDGAVFVPLSFPVEEGKSSWSVTVDYHKEAGTVTIQKTKIWQKLRGKTKCSRCSGNKECQACYPAGSGENATGQPCSVCDGTGDCWYCNGQGEY